jgi:hypothetical protein
MVLSPSLNVRLHGGWFGSMYSISGGVERKHSGAEELCASTSTHYTLEGFEPVDLSLCLTVARRLQDGVAGSGAKITCYGTL